MVNELQQIQLHGKLRILTLITHYLPGYKSGGPLRTVSNMVYRLGDYFEFYIITKDRDEGDREAFSHIQANAWQNVGKAYVYYLARKSWNIRGLLNVLRNSDYDIVYLNSLFARISVYYLLLRRLHLIPDKPVILAPRGETDSGAISLKAIKKYTYIYFAKSMNLYRNILWQASSLYEKEAILRIFHGASIHVAPDLVLPTTYFEQLATLKKIPGTARVLYFSRITPKKNLEFALRCLSKLQYPITFDIYGPITDETYWQKCQTIIEQLPEYISVRYYGAIPNHLAVDIMSKYHALFIPTRGENFGHVFVEAFMAGCLVLTSDRTPWMKSPTCWRRLELPNSRY